MRAAMLRYGSAGALPSASHCYAVGDELHSGWVPLRLRVEAFGSPRQRFATAGAGRCVPVVVR